MRGTILITDADPDITMLVLAVLEDDGFRVLSADDGPATLEALQREGCHLFVTDTMFPQIGGVSVLPYLRDFPGLVTPFVLLASGPVIPRPPHTVILPKPFSIERLSALVGRLLGHRAGQRAH